MIANSALCLLKNVGSRIQLFEEPLRTPGELHLPFHGTVSLPRSCDKPASLGRRLRHLTWHQVLFGS